MASQTDGAIEVPTKIKEAVDYLAKVKPGELVCFYQNLSSLVDGVLTERTKDNKTTIVEFLGTTPTNVAGKSIFRFLLCGSLHELSCNNSRIV